MRFGISLRLIPANAPNRTMRLFLGPTHTPTSLLEIGVARRNRCAQNTANLRLVSGGALPGALFFHDFCGSIWDLNTGQRFTWGVISPISALFAWGAFASKAANPSRNWVIIEGGIKRPRNNNPYGNRRFAGRMLFYSRTFGEIPPRNMAGGEFGAGAIFLML